MKAAKKVTEDSFYRLCKAHDLLYIYADDWRAYSAGKASFAAVEEAAKQLPRAVAVRIWNGVVEEKLVAEARDDYYWKG